MKNTHISSGLAALLLLLVCMPAGAVRSSGNPVPFRQPDGSTFAARVVGDEYFHYIRTVDGCVVVLDRDSGYYCYASVSADGKVKSLGCPYGKPAPPQVVAGSKAPVRIAPRPGSRFHVSPRFSPSLMTKGEGVARRKAVFIPAAFSDLKFKYRHDQIEAMICGQGYSFDGATGSMREYFNDQFCGACIFDFVVAPTVTLSRGYAYYGQNDKDGNDSKAGMLAAEACRLAEAQVDFSDSDDIFIIVAGGAESDGSADEDHIWPHAGYMNLSLDGKRFYSYAVSTELQADMDAYYASGERRTCLSGIGTMCHEYSHCLGLMDMYDTDYEDSGGQSDGLWDTVSLMDAGSYNNNSRTPPSYTALEREMLGIGARWPLSVGEHTLAPISKSNSYICSDTDTRGETFFFEVRDNTGWDRYIGGRGMLIYQVDMSDRPAGYSTTYEQNFSAAQRWDWNEVNANPEHACARLIYPGSPDAYSDDRTALFWGINSAGSAFDAGTKPSFVAWSGAESLLGLKNIARASDGSVSFMVSGPICLDEVETFQESAVISWHLTVSWNSPVEFICDGRTVAVTPDDGEYTVVLDGLQSAATYEATIRLGQEVSVPDLSFSFKTKAFYRDTFPYIYLGTAEKTISGHIKYGSRIPLKVFNATGVDYVAWSLDGRDISVERDGYYHVKSSGVLRAEVYYRNGDCDVIIKELMVK